MGCGVLAANKIAAFVLLQFPSKMAHILESFTEAELEEVFDHPPIREVAFEIRFAPRLRINAELWRIQDLLVDQYPTVSTETVFQSGMGQTLSVNVFRNPAAERVIKVSQENFVLAFTKYSRFEEFQDELTKQVQLFCETFGIDALTRVGLRYVNNILLPAGDTTSSILRYVRPLTDFERISLETVDQFVNEVRLRYRNHSVTLRGVLLGRLEKGRRVYVLDVDCHSSNHNSTKDIPGLVVQYHDSAQRFFLDHITDEYKKVMRGKQ